MHDDAEHRANKSKPHIHDYEAHVRAVEEDLEYYRTKRLEPRIFVMARRGIVTLYDILKAQSYAESNATRPQESGEHAKDIESRIRALEGIGAQHRLQYGHSWQCQPTTR